MSNTPRRRPARPERPGWRPDAPPQHHPDHGPVDEYGDPLTSDPGPGEALHRVEAEVDTEQDGVLVPLVTARGKADVLVPPMETWRSMARAALFTRGDDFTWATLTLSPGDAQTWAELDPTVGDSNRFFAEWRTVTGQSAGESRASRRSSPRTRGR